MKKIIFSMLIGSFIIAPLIILAEYDDTIQYLQNQAQNAWITQALAAAEVENINLDYLNPNTSDLMTAVKNTLALAAVESEDYQSLESLLITINSNFNSGQLGSTDLLNDDFWGLMALASINQTDDVVLLKDFILAHQNSDGGWSWSVSGASDSNDTAAAIMALVDGGLDNSSPEIVNALNYLHSVQNEDGGFGYDQFSDSDGASTAWIIAALNKLNMAVNTWQIGENNPLIFMDSLKRVDGSFAWLPADEDGSPLVTAYALLSLSGRTYPVNYIILENGSTPVGVDLRIEGLDQTICLASDLEAQTVLDLLAVGSQVCNFEYEAIETEYGMYVTMIDGLEAEGINGWHYWVNWQTGMVSVDNYQLEAGDSVLWGYGGLTVYPGRVEANLNDNNLTVSASYFDGQNWLAWPQAEVHVGSAIYTADNNGQVNVTLETEGVYPVWAEQTELYIRSNKVYITIGQGISNTVDLSVNIENGGHHGGDVIAFNVDQTNINFGILNPGQSAETILVLSNTGNVNIYIEASVLGDDPFSSHTILNQELWENYNLSLPVSLSDAVNVSLSIPDDFAGQGQKNGQLIFWATAN
ncbi:MAG: hypothetical protein COV55_01340 [Candidatus Komeilibacteria bacterium CG11_big_fil_rev_8_21_14_0_20_36_20]|uniref:DUF4430 domain-containing protein n=1 Tax=Candidatus Komeilibacteria bacterium CG11_big_fil_rev_8_21_14_0_20_36_20 TaxID=1974477 RepID=A0A2H0NDV9_9BACT|nr:MAG: hypothetical protein COV55_01340 [Candidatus Komeilibacteria bacterium CG11_big_fil_rev_8_21_14_0_20_36_20]PIR81424.1 MAG: hypothetical protein COU21_04310 [Candidatus Komeilibacteria bacterium CG10_big_fil_rev_8_21_14_0_10_36_65]PJC55150.1 MAG: hypothetical protein CO027_03265 [Candidatus Komeilibacteria bacterium CG_4_9_14_0_2_um_filter_36_13]